MHSRYFGLALVLVAATASAGQQRYFFTRKFVVGQTDRYAMKTSVTSPMAMTMSMTMSQTVKKIYPNGDADVETKASPMSMMMNGKPMADPTGGAGNVGKAVTMRLNKFGNPIGGQAGAGSMTGMDMMGSGINGIEKGLIMGKAVPFRVASKGAQGPTISGTIRLASVKNGIARIDQVFDLSLGATATMHGIGAFYLRVKDGVMLSTDMTMSGATMGGQGQMHMSMKRL